MNHLDHPLKAWLEVTVRTPSPFQFEISDVAERAAPDADTVSYLGQVVLRAKTDPAVLQEMADAIGWPDAASRVRRSRLLGVRRGDFGEALVCELLEVLGGHRVPVRKLRFQTDPEQTMHGTDIVGFRLAEDGRVLDLHFVECKLRTRRDLAAGVDAHIQLADDRSLRLRRHPPVPGGAAGGA